MPNYYSIRGLMFSFVFYHNLSKFKCIEHQLFNCLAVFFYKLKQNWNKLCRYQNFVIIWQCFVSCLDTHQVNKLNSLKAMSHLQQNRTIMLYNTVVQQCCTTNFILWYIFSEHKTCLANKLAKHKTCLANMLP